MLTIKNHVNKKISSERGIFPRFIGLKIPLLVLPPILWVIWGYNFLAIKSAVSTCDPLVFCVLRTSFACVLLALLCTLTNSFTLPKNWFLVCVAGFFQIGLLFGFSTVALYYGKCSDASVLSLLAPVWVLVIGRIVFSKPIKKIDFMSLIFALLGVVILFKAPLGTNISISKILSLLAGFSLAIGLVVSKSIKMDNYRDLLNVCTWQMLSGNILLIFLMFIFSDLQTEFNLNFVFCLSYSAIVAGCFAWLLWFFILNNTSAFLSSASVFAVPAFVVLLSAIHFKENVSTNEWVGIFMILTSLGILWLKNHPVSKEDQKV